ncbi:MAG: pantoate--beta-alanine ligase [Myxococcales bacterium]|nr:pantoate--beta-alanine ligase [Myxococcales bacterium]
MKIIERIAEMKAWSLARRREGRTIGFVPTMGYLHEGHLSLVRLALETADTAVMSIFVNPTQFGPTEDFARYPRDLERDAALAESVGVDVIFHPTPAEMYPAGFETTIRVPRTAGPLCGVSRPDHFAGVATVCCKLFNIVQPHLAVFGEKDYQQLLVIRRLVADLDLNLEIVPGPTFREPDGLAMSSRNKYLSPEERARAVVLHQSLNQAEEWVNNPETNRDSLLRSVRARIENTPPARVDYIELRRLPDLADAAEHPQGDHLLALAVFFGKTRLIDNRVLHFAAEGKE